jgi:hypothetical protein
VCDIRKGMSLARLDTSREYLCYSRSVASLMGFAVVLSKELAIQLGDRKRLPAHHGSF